jgi:hypothetical protein
MSWYRKIVADWKHIPAALDYFEAELDGAKLEVKVKGNIEKASTELPGYVEHRFGQLQELEAILEHLNIQLKKKRSEYLRKYLENYNKALSSRDAEKYSDGEAEVVAISELINQVALMRNKFQGITKGFEIKHFQLSNIIKLRVAGMEDADINNRH